MPAEGDPSAKDPTPASWNKWTGCPTAMPCSAALARGPRCVATAANVLRYGNFYGPGSTALLDAVRQRKLPLVGNGAGWWSFISRSA